MSKRFKEGLKERDGRRGIALGRIDQ